jgi:hypothetical protein
MTLVTRYSAEFTGPDIDRLPKFPPYGLGVEDYSQRWFADHAPAAGAVTSWMSASSNPVALAGVGPSPTKVTESGKTFLKFTANGDLGSSGLGDIKTIMALLKPTTPGAGTPLLGTPENSSLNRLASNGGTVMNLSGGGSLATIDNLDRWVVVTVRFDAAASALFVDTTKYAASGSPVQTKATGLRIASNWAGTADSNVGYRELAVWSRALTDTEIVTAVTAIKANNPTFT